MPEPSFDPAQPSPPSGPPRGGSNTDLAVQNIAFDADGSCHIAYYQPNVDIRESGLVTTHTMSVPMGDDYDDEIAALLEAVKYLVLDVLDTLNRVDQSKE